MIDEYVAINGVCVADCKYLSHNLLCECAIKPADDFHCPANPDCYYKQLKRKEQNCDNANSQIVDLEEELDQLKAENEKLQDIANKLLDEKNKYLDRWSINLIYKQTLTEIKPILEFYANSKIGEEQPDRTYKIMLNGGYVMVYDPNPAKQALQKISEVEND